MTNKTNRPFDTGALVDQIYEIALDPETLGEFIDAWVSAGLDASTVRQRLASINQFDEVYQAHLNRAEAFLSRASHGEEEPDLAGTLTPFGSLAAFIVDQHQKVVAHNQGASEAFEATGGAVLESLRMPAEAIAALQGSLVDVFSKTERTDRLLNIGDADPRSTAVFQIRRLPNGAASDTCHALVLTTRYHWQPALGDTLHEVFGLTNAEQGVVRALVDGSDAKAISAERGTSEGTVRNQIKSILAKMNARTQSEVIRLVLSLRDISENTDGGAARRHRTPVFDATDWLMTEVWKPFKTLRLPDGRRLDYHDMGPITGAPVLYSHMGYCMARWHKPMLKLAFQHGLRVICPIRAGYGQSDNLAPTNDVLAATRADTEALLTHLGIERLPYLTQGNDLLFAADYAAHHPHRISELIGVCARPCLPGDRHYSGMGKWHRFFLSTAKHAPHLLHFTSKAAVTMAKRIGVVAMFRQMNQRSPADLALIKDDDLRDVLIANAELIAGKDTDVAQAYTMEILATEGSWSHLLEQCRDIKTWFVNGAEDPATDVATIAEYREAYPWIEVQVLPNAGQLLLYQHYDMLIPRVARAAKVARQA